MVFTALTSRLFRLGLTPHCLLCLDAAVSAPAPLSPDSTVARGTSSCTRGDSSSCDDIMTAAVGWVPRAEKEGMRTGYVDILMEAGGFELDGEGTVASQPHGLALLQPSHTFSPPNHSPN